MAKQSNAKSKVEAPTTRQPEKAKGIIESLNTKFKQSYISDIGDRIVSSFVRYPSWFIDLDIALSGGYMYGKILQLWGYPQSGKSTLAYRLAASAQQFCHSCFTPIVEFMNFETGETKTTCLCGKCNSGQVLFLATEDRFDSDWALLNGVDVNNGFITALAPTIEIAADILEELVIHKACDLVIIDSMAALMPENYIGKAVDGQKLGAHAAGLQNFLSRFLSANSKTGMEIAPEVRETFNKHKPGLPPPPIRTTLIGTNQVRSKIGVAFGSPDVPCGGHFLKHAITQSIRMLSPTINDNIDSKLVTGNVLADFTGKIDKATNGGSAGGKGTYRIWTDDYKTNKIGDTGEPARLLALLKYFGIIRKEKSGYVFAGRTWKAQKDIKTALNYKGMQLFARWVIFSNYLNAAGKLSTKFVDYDYNPYYRIVQKGTYTYGEVTLPEWVLEPRVGAGKSDGGSKPETSGGIPEKKRRGRPKKARSESEA